MIECRWVHHITDHPKGSCFTFRPYTLHVNILLCWLRAHPVWPIIPCITESVLCAVHAILRCLLELCVRSSVPLNRLCQHLRCCFICWYVASSVYAFIVLCWTSHVWFRLQLARWACFISHRWLVMFYLVLSGIFHTPTWGPHSYCKKRLNSSAGPDQRNVSVKIHINKHSACMSAASIMAGSQLSKHCGKIP